MDGEVKEADCILFTQLIPDHYRKKSISGRAQRHVSFKQIKVDRGNTQTAFCRHVTTVAKCSKRDHLLNVCVTMPAAERFSSKLGTNGVH
jgi:hypothetical protein